MVKNGSNFNAIDIPKKVSNIDFIDIIATNVIFDFTDSQVVVPNIIYQKFKMYTLMNFKLNLRWPTSIKVEQVS